jgi:hypothetical protein
VKVLREKKTFPDNSRIRTSDHFLDDDFRALPRNVLQQTSDHKTYIGNAWSAYGPSRVQLAQPLKETT